MAAGQRHRVRRQNLLFTLLLQRNTLSRSEGQSAGAVVAIGNYALSFF
jgi:hypothetical protein